MSVISLCCLIVEQQVFTIQQTPAWGISVKIGARNINVKSTRTRVNRSSPEDRPSHRFLPGTTSTFREGNCKVFILIPGRARRKLRLWPSTCIEPPVHSRMNLVVKENGWSVRVGHCFFFSHFNKSGRPQRLFLSLSYSRRGHYPIIVRALHHHQVGLFR